MKNLISYKIFENVSNFKFNIGDEVVCISNNLVDLNIGEIYTINGRKIYNGVIYYSVVNKYGKTTYSKIHKNEPNFYGEKIFTTELEYNLNKYNI